MSSLQEIQDENFDKLERIFEDRFPKSSRIWNVLKIKSLGQLSSQVVTRFYYFGASMNKDSFIISVQHFQNLAGGYCIIVSEPESKISTELVLKALEDFIDWDQTINFCDFDGNEPLVPFFEKIAKERRAIGKNVQLTILQSFGFMMNLSNALTLNLDQFYGNTASMDRTEARITVKKLETEKDISDIDSKWERPTKSRDVVETSIRSLPSAGVYLGEELVSWAFTSFYGSLSGLGTSPHHQRKGYAQLVAKSVAKGQAELGIFPSARTLRSNLRAQRTLEGAGFFRTHETYWISYKNI